jgi:glucose-1-phosphate cytidylyltransferase
MKIIILAGGLGTRISEETNDKPKPMVLIDGLPLLWHLMHIFAIQGFNDFVLAVGYKASIIKDWFTDEKNSNFLNGWKIDLVDTGLDTQTGGRISICMDAYPNQQVLVTYGDGLANIQVSTLLKFHNSQNTLATVTAVRPPARFGTLNIKGGKVMKFAEKVQSDAGWINGGFFVLEPKVKNYVTSPLEPFESGALPRLVAEQQVTAYKHFDFWKPMDTLREKNELEVLARREPVPWLKDLKIDR